MPLVMSNRRNVMVLLQVCTIWWVVPLAGSCSKKSSESATSQNPSAKPPNAAATKKAEHVMPQNPAAAPNEPKAPADVAAPPADAQRTASGLASKVLKPGSGSDRPNASARVKVHYSGWTTDGKLFDSSVMRGQPAEFPLANVIAGWTEGLQLMSVGEQRRFWIPQELAYKGRPGAPAGMLVFDVELLSFVAGPKMPEAPADVAQPPKTAKHTKSGLHWRVLEKGKGSKHPSASSQVEVHYSGWTTDGKLFDSSVMRGETATFPLNGVIAGWTEGLQLMTEGEKARFWIPEALAYKGQPGAPAGMLVFDVELIRILN